MDEAKSLVEEHKMERQEILQAIKTVKSNSTKRKFTESVDFIINLKGLNIKKEEEKVSAFIPIPHFRGKKVTTTALVDQALSTKAKASCDHVILLDDFKKQDKKSIRKLAVKTDYFIAQANIMPKVAATFGRALGPKGKMPNPKAGCVVQPTAELQPLVERLQKLIRLETKNEPTIKTSIGMASMTDEHLADNAMAIYNYIVSHVPQEKNNIKSIMLKLTMGTPIKLGENAVKVEASKK